MRMKVLRRYLNILILIFCALFIVSCNNIDKEKDNLKGKIHITAYENNYEYLKVMAHRFQEIHPKVQIDVTEIQKDRVYEESDKILGGKGENIDMMVMTSEMVTSYAYKYPLSLYEVNEFMSSYKDEIPKERLEQVSINNKIMAVPWNNEVAVVYYNRELLKKYNIEQEDIRTWDDLINISGVRLENNEVDTPIIYAGEDLYSFYALFLKQLNFSPDKGKDFLLKDESMKSMAMIKRLFSTNIVNILSEDKALEKLISKESAFIIGSNKLLKDINKDSSNLPNKIGIMQLPAFEPGGNRDAIFSGNNLVILEKSEEKDLCKEFIKFILWNKENALYGLENYMILPLYSGIKNDGVFDKSYEILQGQKPLRLFDYIQKNSYITKNKFKCISIRNYMNENFSKIINSNNGLEQDMKALSTELNSILEKNKSTNP